MAYTPTTKVPNLTELVFFQWRQPGSTTAPRLAAPIDANTTTITFTAPPLDHTGTVITVAFVMGIKDSVTGSIQSVYVPGGGLTADGLTAINVVRGVRLEGLDFTTGDSAKSTAAGQDSEVFCEISGILQAINTAGLTAQIGANIKFNGRPLFMGSGVAACPVFADAAARDAAITVPLNGDMCYLTIPGQFFDYQGGSWQARANGVNPNASEIVAGKVELATNAEMGLGTSIGGTGARLVPPNDQLVQTPSGAGDHNKLATLDAGGKFATGFVPVVDDTSKVSKSILSAKGSIIAATAAATPADFPVGANDTVVVADSAQADGLKWSYAPFSLSILNAGIATRVADTASSAQVIAHGLTRIPKFVRITANYNGAAGDTKPHPHSMGIFFNGTTNCVYTVGGENGNTNFSGNSTVNVIELVVGGATNNQDTNVATISVDATNITLNWVLSNTHTFFSGSGLLNVLWEVLG